MLTGRPATDRGHGTTADVGRIIRPIEFDGEIMRSAAAVSRWYNIWVTRLYPLKRLFGAGVFVWIMSFLRSAVRFCGTGRRNIITTTFECLDRLQHTISIRVRLLLFRISLAFGMETVDISPWSEIRASQRGQSTRLSIK